VTCWPWSHKWTKWEQYPWVGTIRFFDDRAAIPKSERRQRRHCEICGTEQDEKVRNG
jgi:hypothetical protein